MQAPRPVFRSNTLPAQFSSFEFLMSPPTPPKVESVPHRLDALPDELLGLILACFPPDEMPGLLGRLARSSPLGTRLAVRGFNALELSLRQRAAVEQCSLAVESSRKLDGLSRSALLARAARQAAALGVLFPAPVEDWAPIREALAGSSFRPGLSLVYRLPFYSHASTYGDASERRELGKLSRVLDIVRDALAWHPDPGNRPDLNLFLRPEEGEDASLLIKAVEEYGKIRVLAVEGTLDAIVSLLPIIKLPSIKRMYLNLLPSTQVWSSFYALYAGLLLASGLENVTLTGFVVDGSWQVAPLILSHLHGRFGGVVYCDPESKPFGGSWPKVEFLRREGGFRTETREGEQVHVDEKIPADFLTRGTAIAMRDNAMRFARTGQKKDWFSDYVFNWPRFNQYSPGEFVQEQLVCGLDRKRSDQPKHLQATVVANASFFVDDLAEHASELRQLDLICCTPDLRLWDALARLLCSSPQLERLCVCAPYTGDRLAFDQHLLQHADRLDFLLLSLNPGAALYSLACRNEGGRLEVDASLWLPPTSGPRAIRGFVTTPPGTVFDVELLSNGQQAARMLCYRAAERETQ